MAVAQQKALDKSTDKPQSIDQLAEELAGQYFDQAQTDFISRLRAINPDAADAIAESVAALKDQFTPEAASEIKALREEGDEVSIRQALEKVAELRAALDGATPSLSSSSAPVSQSLSSLSADKILSGFKKLDNEIVEITLPVGTSVQVAGEILNAAAKEKGLRFPVFYEGDREFWASNEAGEHKTEPGKTYQFKIPANSVSKTKSEQVSEYGEAAPLGAIAIAEACERLSTENNSTLFKQSNGSRMWVRGSAPGRALCSHPRNGVDVNGDGDDDGNSFVGFAALASSRN